MLRIRLGAEDLMRIRVAAALDPFAETMMAAGLIRRRSPSPVFRSWRRSLRGQLGGQLRPLASIFPADREWLDLATLVGQVDTVEEGAEAFLAVRRQHLGQEIEWLFVRHAQLPRSMWGLCADLQLRRQLAAAICSFHDVAVGPYWPRLRNFLQAERTHQIQYLATAGIDRFLAALCPPLIQWHPPVLEVRGRGGPRDMDLGGRGLVIVPSVFLGAEARVTSDACDADTPRLSYPVVRDINAARQVWTGSRDEQALAALLGRTRSAALEAIAQGCGTSELAVRVGISPAAASQHAAVLRRSGLITTQRHGGTVLHTVTTLGATLLSGDS